MARGCRRHISRHLFAVIVSQADDVIVEAESSCSASEEEEDAEEAGDSENDIKQLKARRHALTNKLAKQQKRRDRIQVRCAGVQLPTVKHFEVLVFNAGCWPT